MSWGYAINQWKPGMAHFVRREEHERAFKTIAATGFEAIELRAGTFRWEPLGRPERIAQYYGSVDAFLDVVQECGLQRVISYFFDPAEPIFEEMSFGRDPLDPAQRDGIVAATRPFTEFLQAAGGAVLVVRPVGSHWRVGRLTDPQLEDLAATWNAVSASASEHGVAVALHVDCLCALQTVDEISALLEQTEPRVGLAIDTAELTIAGIDPVELIERHPDRVAHVHLKDVRATDTLAERLEEQAELRFLSAGGSRGIDRWFWELGTADSLVDLKGVFQALVTHRYTGALVVESDQSPDPAGSAMLNGWYMQRHAPAPPSA